MAKKIKEKYSRWWPWKASWHIWLGLFNWCNVA
jgi:hypothetical protein